MGSSKCDSGFNRACDIHSDTDIKVKLHYSEA